MVNIMDFKAWFGLPANTSSLAAGSDDVIKGKHRHPQNECFISDETVEKERKIAVKSQLATPVSPTIRTNTPEPSVSARPNRRKGPFTDRNSTDHDYFKNSFKSTKSNEEAKTISQSSPIFNVSPMVPVGTPSSQIGSEMSSVNSETLFLPPAATSSLVSASGEKDEASTAHQNIDHFKGWLKPTKAIEKEEEEISPIMTASSDLPEKALSLAAEESKNKRYMIVFETASNDIGIKKSCFSSNGDEILRKHYTNTDSASHFWASISGAIGKKTKRKDIPYYSGTDHERPSHTLTKPMRKLFKKKVWWTSERRNREKRASSESSYYDNDPSFSCDSKTQNANHHRHLGKREYVILALKEAVGKKGYLSSTDIDKQTDFINRDHKIRKWKNRDPQVSHIVGICEPWELNQPINEVQSNASLHILTIAREESGPEILFHKDSSSVPDPNNKNRVSGIKEGHKPLTLDTSLKTKKIFNDDSFHGPIKSSRFSPIRQTAQEEVRELDKELLWTGDLMYRNENATTRLSFQKITVPQNTLSTDKRKINPPISQQHKGDYSSLADHETSQKFSPSPKLKEASYPLCFRSNVPNHEVYESYENDYDNSSIISIVNDEAKYRPYCHQNQVFDASTAPNLRAPFPYIPPDFQSSELPPIETNAFVFDMDVQQIVEKLVSSRKASAHQSHHHEGIRKLSGISSSGLVPNFNSEQKIRPIAEWEHSEESISSNNDIEDYEIVLPKRRPNNDNILKPVPNVEESFVEGSSSCYDLSENQLITTDHDMEETQFSFETVIHHPLRSISAGAISLHHDDDFDISALKLNSDDECKNGQQPPSSNITADLLPQKKDLGSLFDAAGIKNQENVALSNASHHVIMSTLLTADTRANVPGSVSSETNNREDITAIHCSIPSPHLSFSEYGHHRNEDDPVDIKHQVVPNVRVRSMQAYTTSAERPRPIPAYRVNSFSSIDICKTLHMLGKPFSREIPGLGAYGNNREVNQGLRFNEVLDGVPEKNSSYLPSHLLQEAVNVNEDYPISVDEVFEGAKNSNEVTDSCDNNEAKIKNDFEPSAPQRIPPFVDELFGTKQYESEVPDKKDETHLLPNVERPIVLVEEEPNAEKLLIGSRDPLDAPCLVHWPVGEENWFAKILGEYCPTRFRNNERFNYDSYGFKVKQYYMTTRALLQDRYKTCSKVVFAPRPDKWLNFEMEMDYLDEIDDFIKINKNLCPLFKGPRIVRRKHMIRRWMNRKRDRQIIMEQLMEYWRRDPHIIDRLKWERQILKPFPTDGTSPPDTHSGYKPCQCPERPSLKLVASKIFQRMTMDLAHKRLGRPPRQGSSVIMLRKGPPLGIDYFGYKRDRIREWAHDFLLNL